VLCPRPAYTALLFSLLFVGLAAPAGAQHTASTTDDFSDITITEKLRAPIPHDLTFKDETGKSVRLTDLFDGTKPVILTPVYYTCPLTCNLLLSGLVNSLQDGRFAPSEDFRIISVSIDPKETPTLAAGKKAAYLKQMGVPAAGDDWHFLTGDRDSIKALTTSIGFGYRYNPETMEYVHRAALVFYTPDGVVQRYLHGTNVVAGQLELALVDAGQGSLGSLVDQMHLVAFQYDASVRRYVFDLVSVTTIVGLVTMMIFGLILVSIKRRLAAA